MDDRPLHASPAVRASVSGDGLVLLDVDGGLVLSANAVGARIWQLIEQALTPGEIAARIGDEYDVPRERADRDVLLFIQALRTRGLVDGGHGR